jgi:hypothetical protein
MLTGMECDTPLSLKGRTLPVAKAADTNLGRTNVKKEGKKKEGRRREEGWQGVQEGYAGRL